MDCAKVNMLRWVANLVGGYPEGSKEIMLALYNIKMLRSYSMQMWYTHLKYIIKEHKGMNIGKTHS